MRILFILKRNETYGFNHYSRRSSGLWNSTRFIVEAMNHRGHDTHIVEVEDNNSIDKVVTQIKPDVVVIEALWVVPEKFPILMKLHPNVKWFCHLHSHMPFIALEGIAMEWIQAYARKGIGLIANSLASYEALRCILTRHEVTFLPNVYLSKPHRPEFYEKDTLDIGCFGAVRPLKNQLLQALAAIKFARDLGKNLRFHINGTRTETGGDPVLKNLRKLFEQQPDAMLIENKWHEPEGFIALCRRMDIGMQVSLTETFNVVTADYVTAGIPVVVSKEVVWTNHFSKAQDDSVKSIVSVMHRAYQNKVLVKWNQSRLLKFSGEAQDMWEQWILNIESDGVECE